MPLPSDYVYKDGAYWKRDETGPFNWTGSTPMPIGGFPALGGAAAAQTDIAPAGYEQAMNMLASGLLLQTLPAAVSATGIIIVGTHALAGVMVYSVTPTVTLAMYDGSDASGKLVATLSLTAVGPVAIFGSVIPGAAHRMTNGLYVTQTGVASWSPLYRQV